MRGKLCGLAMCIVLLGLGCPTRAVEGPLPGTQLLEALPADPAAEMVAGVDRFLLNNIEQVRAGRSLHWQTATAKTENSAFLNRRLGIEPRVSPETAIQYELPAIPGANSAEIYSIRWPILAHPAPHLKDTVTLWGAGLLMRPTQPIPGLLVFVPDADETPEQCLGLTAEGDDGGSGSALEAQRLIMRFLHAGFTVVIPQLVSREMHQHGRASMTRREFIQRSSYELGRTLTGYEVQSVLALVDRASSGVSLIDSNSGDNMSATVVVGGFGEGGRTALFAGALDTRIDATFCGGYFGPREAMWHEPISRNIFGLLERFSDAELGALIAPRGLIICTAPEYSVDLAAGTSGAPAHWQSPPLDAVRDEFARMKSMWQDSAATVRSPVLIDGTSAASPIAQTIAAAIAERLSLPQLLEPAATTIQQGADESLRARERAAARGRSQLASMDAHNQSLLVESEYERVQFLNIGLQRDDSANQSNSVDTASEQAYVDSIERFRTIFRRQIIGEFDQPLLPPAPRVRESMHGKNWIGYDVVLDVFPDVIAYGVLLVPQNIAADERRPVVVCQHGLEGRPQDTISGDHRAYHDYAAQLAERGFVVFAPQNPYIGHDSFRTLQRKANSIGKTLFSIITPQHRQIVAWLGDLPFVDRQRIAFYGLSYGGKSAMRLPALIPEYCMSICSADFNDWVWKNASSRSTYSYLGTGEYEIFEFDLGPKFNYAEMAALIAPRPFMVERGHLDGVAPDDRVAKEFAKVRFLYEARLGIADRCEIEWFNGPHTINGQGTFEFLHQQLGFSHK